jgi:hypothetical protein
MFPEKIKRSTRRFHRRIASSRRHMLRQIHRDSDTVSSDPERIVSRIPTVQEKRINEAFHQDLREVEIA